MRKDDGSVQGWCKHTSNEFGEGGRKSRQIINKRIRKNVKAKLARDPDSLMGTRYQGMESEDNS